MNTTKQLLRYYSDRGMLSESQASQLESDCIRSGADCVSRMVERRMVPETEAYRALADYLCLPFSEMDMLEADAGLLADYHLSYLKSKKTLPLKRGADGVLIAATSDPLSMESRMALSLTHAGPVAFVLVPLSQLVRYLDTALTADATKAAIHEIHRETETQIAAAIEDTEDRENTNAPAVRLVDSVLREAVPLRASDIHIEPFETYVRVRYRIDGDLMERTTFPISAYRAIGARIKIMAGINIAERRIPQDGRISMRINDVEYDYRVSTLPTVYGEKFVIRILDKNAFNFTRSELGFTEDGNRKIDRILSHPHGIVLLTGPTGCGKTTSLYSFLKELNRPEINIVTVEDPVEHSIDGISQVQVNPKADMTFATFIRSILRQDPNIIMVGEIRDAETAQIAVRAAITGHLVFSTLHTNDAPGAVERMEDMGVDSYLLADALVGVISQRLVKKLCPVCRKKRPANPRELEMLMETEPREIYEPRGCQFCNHTGYKGRTAVHEIMFVDEEIRQLINSGAPAGELRRATQEKGMLTLWETCRQYVYDGTTSMQELLAMQFE